MSHSLSLRWQAMSDLLGRYGVRTLVIDKAQDIFTAPRAIALDHEAYSKSEVIAAGGVSEEELREEDLPPAPATPAVAGVPEVGMPTAAACSPVNAAMWRQSTKSAMATIAPNVSASTARPVSASTPSTRSSQARAMRWP